MLKIVSLKVFTRVWRKAIKTSQYLRTGEWVVVAIFFGIMTVLAICGVVRYRQDSNFIKHSYVSDLIKGDKREIVVAIDRSGPVKLEDDFEASATLVSMLPRLLHEPALNSELTQYPVLHFATHGMLDPENPMVSEPLFSPVNEHGEAVNGLLLSQEIIQLKLSAELVALSACQTGVAAGEHQPSIAQSFLRAGVPSVAVIADPVFGKYDKRVLVQLAPAAETSTGLMAGCSWTANSSSVWIPMFAGFSSDVGGALDSQTASRRGYASLVSLSGYCPVLETFSGYSVESMTYQMLFGKDWNITISRPQTSDEESKRGFLFWIMVIQAVGNAIAAFSAIILAWFANNRAKAELILKQAEFELKLREMAWKEAEALQKSREAENRLAQMELELAKARNSQPLILTA